MRQLDLIRERLAQLDSVVDGRGYFVSPDNLHKLARLDVPKNLERYMSRDLGDYVGPWYLEDVRFLLELLHIKEEKEVEGW